MTAVEKAKYIVQKPYKELNEDLKQAGWVVVKDGDEWLDFCNKDCEEEYF